ncbi:MAG: DegT/DnrJ/EryC1/StrS family aminotransferase [Synergistaceae bacterium]|nr:DegT/DnrJ/EryC1/StrS family aminotransferase [Candidatus Equadaptatus faecalis]
MQFRDLKRQYAVLKNDIDAGISEVIENTSFISGKKVAEFEEQLAAYAGRKYCVACGNGTDALTMALMALNIGKGDAVFVPDFTFFATGEVASFLGAVPVFVDVDPVTFNMDAASLKKAVEAVVKEGKLKPKLVIPVDLFGLPADFSALEAIAKEYGMFVLEDAAQGFGGERRGKKACSFGDISATSFFPAKPLGCYGDGGAVFTDNDGVNAYLRSIAVHGKGTMKYDNVRIGWNSRLDTIQAAILLPKFKAFADYELDKVNEAAKKYNELFAGLEKFVTVPEIPEGYLSSWAQYTVKVKKRSELQTFLKEKGIPSMVYYPKPMHEQKAFDGLTQYTDCPNTEKLCTQVLSLPMHPYFEDGEIEFVVNALKEFYEVHH